MESSPSSSELPAGVSVVICCYNSAARLPDTLRHLLRQKMVSPVAWEVIVVDNASTDATERVAQGCWPVHPSAPLRVVRELEQGLSHARRCGVMVAAYDVISFIDDDNWVAPDWIERIRSIFDAHPEVGVCGGKSEPVPETVPPAWFQQMKGFYATGSQHPVDGDITNKSGTLLWGAGLSIRTRALRELFSGGFEFLLTGRSGANTGAGEDTEICFALREMGWHFWYDDHLVLEHFIPSERLTWGYALRLMEGMGKASVLFEIYLMAARRDQYAVAPPWKRTWLFQYLKARRDVRRLRQLHRTECLEKTEGSWNALQFQAAIGRLEVLRSLKGRFGRMIRELATAFAALRKR